MYLNFVLTFPWYLCKTNPCLIIVFATWFREKEEELNWELYIFTHIYICPSVIINYVNEIVLAIGNLVLTLLLKSLQTNKNHRLLFWKFFSELIKASTHMRKMTEKGVTCIALLFCLYFCYGSSDDFCFQETGRVKKKK